MAGHVEAKLPEAVADPLAHLRRVAGLKAITPLFSAATADVDPVRKLALSSRQTAVQAAKSLDGANKPRLRGATLVELDEQAVDRRLLKGLEASRAIEYVERVPNRWTCELDAAASRQWNLHAIQWFGAALPRERNVVVTVLDTGVDASHPDLAKAIAAYEHRGNGHRDFTGHGTHVAGIIAAVASHAVGVHGVAGCKVHCVKVFDDPKPKGAEGPFNFQTYSDALNDLLAPGNARRIVNLSIGGNEYSRTEEDLFASLIEADIFVCAAMGNEHDNEKIDPALRDVSYPAMFKDVLAVGAVDEADRRAPFSCIGKHIGLVAPGVRVLSTVPTYPALYADDTDYDSWPGTSMACPHVAAAAAVLSAANPDKGAAWIRDRLLSTAVKVDRMKGKDFTPEYGFGLLNLAGALGKGRSKK